MPLISASIIGKRLPWRTGWQLRYGAPVRSIEPSVSLIRLSTLSTLSPPRRSGIKSIRQDMLCTLAEILVESGQIGQAGVIYREVLELCIRDSGESHPSSLAAKGDLATVLFELGQTTEASCLEGQAYADARLYLGRAHPVTCVLAWNRLLRCETGGEADSAGAILVEELAWLLIHEGEPLSSDQEMIRTMLARRLNWDSAGAC